MRSSWLLPLVICSAAAAQSTWVVNAGGTGDFLDLPSAVAFAASGDTIIVQVGPLGEGATGFLTNKGLTIIGEGGSVPITTTGLAPVQVNGLPAGESFRMAGFLQTSPGPVNVWLNYCDGPVHLERIRASVPAVSTGLPSISIYQCGAVTMREVVNYGSPAVDIDLSAAVIVDCQFGLMNLGLGGGQALTSWYSTIIVVRPRFDTGSGAASAITMLQGNLVVTGDANSYMRNPTGPVVYAQGTYSTVVDPIVTLVPGSSSPAITGSGTVTNIVAPASWVSDAHPGQTMTISSRVPPGAFLFQAFGVAGPPQATPLGILGIDAGLPYVYFPMAVPPTGLWSTPLAVPATLPLGSDFATQAVYFDSGALRFGFPSTFVVH